MVFHFPILVRDCINRADLLSLLWLFSGIFPLNFAVVEGVYEDHIGTVI